MRGGEGGGYSEKIGLVFLFRHEEFIGALGYEHMNGLSVSVLETLTSSGIAGVTWTLMRAANNQSLALRSSPLPLARGWGQIQSSPGTRHPHHHSQTVSRSTGHFRAGLDSHILTLQENLTSSRQKLYKGAKKCSYL